MMAGGCRKIRVGEANLEDCFYHRSPKLPQIENIFINLNSK